jgi:hypothetical protein
VVAFYMTLLIFAPAKTPIHTKLSCWRRKFVKGSDEGVTIVGEMETYDYGKFGWIVDPEEIKLNSETNHKYFYKWHVIN